jgi:glycosidase
MPVLYYGDEIGLAGATDPDSRRVMPADSALSPLQLSLRQNTQTLGQARACSSTLRRGARTTRYASSDTIVIELNDAVGAALIVISRSRAAQTIPLTGLSTEHYADIISHAAITAPNGTVSLTVPPLSAAVYLSTPSPCVQ